MEDLYSDLENYQLENVVSELRNENQELKCKLEEYASTLASVQEDFDKLSSEYKKLELNYSSLLKTARAEIERKSQQITNLNIEKDKLVINMIQSTGKIQNRKINGIGNKQQSGIQFAKGAAAKGHNTALNSTDNNDCMTLNHEMKDKHDKTAFSLGPTVMDDPDVKAKEQKSKKSDFEKDREKNKNHDKQSKENRTDVFNDCDVAKVSKIKNRRKSMPLLNRDDIKLSADEDEDYGRKDHRFRRKTPIKDDRLLTDRLHHDKYRNGRNDPERKVPEFIRTGDKYASNYDYVSRKSSNWYRDNERHKSRDNRDKYESNQRSRRCYTPDRRYYSPDRPYNVQVEYYNKHRESYDKLNRPDNVRHRKLMSPPPERYSQYRRSREFDGPRFQHVEAYPKKHKIHDVIEEPACKRLRSESINKHSDKPISSFDGDVESRANSMTKPLEIPYLSLQSPDYVNFENNPPSHQIKEIKGTSDIKLDDPRLTSKKYVVSTQRDNVTLSTVVGRDVDMKAIDTTIWNKKTDKKIHEMPILLREKPPISEDLVKDIYMGIDNPISNLSMESGEICLEEELEAVHKNKGIADTEVITVHPNNEKSESILHNVGSRNHIEVNKKEITDIIDTQQTCPTFSSKSYRIPKVKKSNTPKLLEDDNTYGTTSAKLNKKEASKQSHKTKQIKEKREVEKKLQSEIAYKSLKTFSGAIDDSKNKNHKLVDMNHKNHSIEKTISHIKDTVEGDLELSDDTCDYVEVSDQKRNDKENNSQKFGECSENVVIDNIKKDLNIRESEMLDRINKEHTVYEHESETHSKNKHFNISKSNEILPKVLSNETLKEQKSQDIKSKLCDLFGDTSSLITLDDLGIVVPSATKENLIEYAPLCENTQDAVDLNVEEMEKVQTRSMKLNHEKDEPFKDTNKEITLEKEVKNNDHITSIKENMKINSDIEKTSSIQNIFENVNLEPKDDSVVKTVIISTGIQNNCDSGAERDRKQEEQLTTIGRTTNDNATYCPALLSIKALATSTPYKPQNEHSSSVPEISCNSSVMGKDVSIVSSNTENVSKTSQNNLDIPDVRIIVKRRRKAKGAPC